MTVTGRSGVKRTGFVWKVVCVCKWIRTVWWRGRWENPQWCLCVGESCEIKCMGEEPGVRQVFITVTGGRQSIAWNRIDVALWVCGTLVWLLQFLSAIGSKQGRVVVLNLGCTTAWECLKLQVSEPNSQRLKFPRTDTCLKFPRFCTAEAENRWISTEICPLQEDAIGKDLEDERSTANAF